MEDVAHFCEDSLGVRVSDKMKITTCSLKFDGVVEKWYATLDKQSAVATNWNEFKTAFVRRFDPNAEFKELQFLRYVKARTSHWRSMFRSFLGFFRLQGDKAYRCLTLLFSVSSKACEIQPCGTAFLPRDLATWRPWTASWLL